MATTTIKDGFNGGSDNQLKVNADGSINVDVSGGAGSTVNLTEVGGQTITLGQATEANSLPVVIASNQSPIPITGTITATNPSVGTTGTTAPTSATEVGGVNASGNLVPLTVDPSGKLLVDISGTSTVTGTVNSDLLGLTAFQTSQYSVGATAVQITPTPITNRSSLTLRATTVSNAIIYVGPTASVTTSNGWPMYNGDTLQMDLTPANTIYAISTVAGNTLFALEMA